MSRYFFDINDGQTRKPDHEGQSLTDAVEAQRIAVRELADMIRDELPDGDRASYVVTVRDESGNPVYVATAMFLAEPLDTDPAFAPDPPHSDPL